MQIFVRSLIGKYYSLEVEYWFTITKVKQLLFEKSGIHPFSQILTYNNKVLYNDMDIADINTAIFKYQMMFCECFCKTFSSVLMLHCCLILNDHVYNN